MENEVTICDRCSREIETDEANYLEEGEWQDATLCNDCYAIVCEEEAE